MVSPTSTTTTTQHQQRQRQRHRNDGVPSATGIGFPFSIVFKSLVSTFALHWDLFILTLIDASFFTTTDCPSQAIQEGFQGFNPGRAPPGLEPGRNDDDDDDDDDDASPQFGFRRGGENNLHLRSLLFVSSLLHHATTASNHLSGKSLNVVNRYYLKIMQYYLSNKVSATAFLINLCLPYFLQQPETSFSGEGIRVGGGEAPCPLPISPIPWLPTVEEEEEEKEENEVEDILFDQSKNLLLLFLLLFIPNLSSFAYSLNYAKLGSK